MSIIKKWQCPHCPQDSTRRWNAVVHIRRKHAFGNPVEKRDPDQARRLFSFQPDKRNENREYSQSHPNNSRYNVGYKMRGRGNDDFGDTIDYMFRSLTYFDENIYKAAEIKKIADRHNSSKAPKWFPLSNYDPDAFANAFRTWLAEEMKNYHSSTQRDSDTTVAARSNQEIKKASHDPFPSAGKDNAPQSTYKINEERKDEMIEEDGWLVKRDIYGDPIIAYRLHESFFDT